MAEYLGHDLLNAIDASICGHPGHHFAAFSPEVRTPGMVSLSKWGLSWLLAFLALYIAGAITAVTLAPPP